MAVTQFEATVQSHDGRWRSSTSPGSIDAGADARAGRRLFRSRATTGGALRSSRLHEAVDYINSTGIALIVGILARSKKEQREVLACGLSEHYRKIFEITRVADFMHLFQDEQAAIKQAS